MKTIASCSFGKDSMAAIITHIEHSGKVDEAVYCKIMYDGKTSAELPEHEEWIYRTAIPKLEKEYGVKTVIVQADWSYKKQFYRKVEKGINKGRIYGFPFMLGNWCNSGLKVAPLNKYKNTFNEVKEIIGITIDEPNRMLKKRKNENVILPLVKHNITQLQSFEIAEKAGLLSPAYKNGTKRLGCWFCHNQRIGELRKLRKEYPMFWQELLKLDKDSPITFKVGITVAKLEERFAMEDRQISFWEAN